MAIIYFLDADKSVQKSIDIFLSFEGHKGTFFNKSLELCKKFEVARPDLLVVDPIVENFSGYRIVKNLKEFYKFRFLFLSSLNSESDRILGLEMGAEDYICKPMNNREIYLRIRNILRHVKNSQKKEKYFKFIFQNYILEFEFATRTCKLNSYEIPFTQSQWKICYLLCENAQVGVSREKIGRECLCQKPNGYARVVDNHVKNIRKMIKIPGVIENVRGYGYRFNGEVYKSKKMVEKHTNKLKST